MAASLSKGKVKKFCSSYLPKPIITLIQKRRELFYRTDMLLFPGKMKYFCPCCGLKCRAFVVGYYKRYPNKFNQSRYLKTRQDVHCPFCNSMPRHRILALWCEEHKGLLRNSNILYFAPEKSMMLWMKRNCISCTTADMFSAADIKLDIQETGLPSESYDVVICNHVLEHVDDFRIALAEIWRILRKGGLLICSFPMDPKVELLDEDPSLTTIEERFRRFGQDDHKRIFGMKAEKFLTDAGFIVEVIKGSDYPEEILPVVGPADYDINVLFCCKK